MKERTPDEMIHDLWHWAFGNGRKGVEARLEDLEEFRRDIATKTDVSCAEADFEKKIDKLDAKLDALTKVLNIHEIIKLVLIVASVVAAFYAGGGVG